MKLLITAVSILPEFHKINKWLHIKLSFWNKLKLLPLFILLGSLLFPANADHLLLTRVVTQPDAAESISIHNPTDSPIDLSNYYICDDEEYYKMQTEGTMTPSHFLHGFTARFPQIFIPAGDTLHIILNENYNSSGLWKCRYTLRDCITKLQL